MEKMLEGKGDPKSLSGKLRGKNLKSRRSEPMQTVWFVAVALATAAAALSQLRSPSTSSRLNRPVASEESTLEIDPNKTLEIIRGKIDNQNSSMISNSKTKVDFSETP